MPLPRLKRRSDALGGGQKIGLADIQEAARTYLQPSHSLRTILRAQK